MSPPHPAPDTPQPAVSPAAAGVEEDLAMLDRLARKGMALAEAVTEDGSKDSAQAFDRFSRAVRLTIMLKAKLRAGPAAWIVAGVAKAKNHATDAGSELDGEALDPYAALKTGKKARVRELVRDIIDRETPDAEDNDTLVDALEERLLCDEAYDDFEGLPLRDIVERLCADLELKPKWYRWIDEKEGWKPNPPFHRPLCSAFKTPSRRPILNYEPNPHLLE